MRRTTAPLTMIAASSTTLTSVRRRSAADDRWGPRIGASVGTAAAPVRIARGRATRGCIDRAAWSRLPRMPNAPAYDEFGLFHENAEEFGIAWTGPPTVRRVEVEDRPAARSARCVWGTGAPELVLLHGGAQNAHTWDTVALALDRPLVAIDLPGPRALRRTATTTRTGPPRTRHRVEQAVRALAPDARARRRHVARRAHRRSRSPTARPTSCVSSCSST